METPTITPAPVQKTKQEHTARFLKHFGRTPGQIVEYPQEAPGGGWRDAARRVFDPKLHQMGANGKPLCGPKGNFLRIPSEVRTFATAHTQPEPASESPNSHGSQPAQAPETPPPVDTPLPPLPPLKTPDGYAPVATVSGGEDLTAAAAEIVFVEEQSAMAIISDEWKMTDDEKKVLQEAFVKMMRATGKKIDMPWQVTLGAAQLRYAGPRLEMPKTQAKVKSWREKITGWISRFRGVGQ